MIGIDETKRQNEVRRAVFAVWVALTIVIALYVAIAGPLMPELGNDMWLIGIVVPALMIVLAGIGLAWLVWLCTSGGRKAGDTGKHD